MKHIAILILLLSFIFTMNLTAQEIQNRNIIGIDIFDLPATTFSLKYQYSSSPKYSLNVNGGFTMNYAKSADVVGVFTAFHQFTDCENELFSADNENGAFIKFGGQLNFRKSFDKNHFYIGVYQTNSFVNQKGKQGYFTEEDIEYRNVNMKKYFIGVATNFGYHFRVQKRLQFDCGLQLSKQFNDNRDLFGIENYIPGIGFHAHNIGEEIFHRFYFNICYYIGKQN